VGPGLKETLEGYSLFFVGESLQSSPDFLCGHRILFE
jgi:hypothetical protein